MMTVVCKRHLFLAFLLDSLLQCTFAENCPQDLANVVVYAGNSTSFSRANDGRPVKWQVASSSVTLASLKDITDNNDVVATQYATTYAVNSSQLTIFTATTAPEGTMPAATAGLYIVNYREPDCMSGAGLVVVDNGPTCTCDASTPNSVRLQCSVDFASYIRQQIRPIMTWKTNSGATVLLLRDKPQPTSLDLNNQGLQNSVSQYSFAASGSAPSDYECQLTFSPPSSEQPGFIASNAPVFTASCFVANCAIDLVTTPAQKSTAPPASMMTLPSAAVTQMTTSALNCSAQRLVNTVVYDGSVASFSRTDNAPLAVKWQVAPSSSSLNSLADVTSYDDRVTPPFRATYAVNSSRLTILKAAVAPASDGSTPYSTAGLYAIVYQNSNCMKAAGLVVIRSGPSCSCDASNRNSVKLNCSVVFANYINQRINPIMTWTNSSGTVSRVGPQPVSLDNANPGLQSAVSQLPVAGTDAAVYECRLTFSSPTAVQPEFVAANAPNFAASCSTANCAVRTTTEPFISAHTTTQAPASTVAPQTNGSSTSFESTAISPVSTTLSNSTLIPPVSTAPSNSTLIPPVSTAPSNSTLIPPVSTAPSNSTLIPPVSTTLSNSTLIPPVSTAPSNSTLIPPVSTAPSNSTLIPPFSTAPSNSTLIPPFPTTLSNSTSPDTSLSTYNSSVTISIPSLNESTEPYDQFSQSSTLRPSSAAAILAMSGSESEKQARTILLSLIFGSLLTTAVVIVLWYFCCCPIPPGKTGTKRRINVRRNIFKTQRKEQATLNTQPREQATLNTQPREQTTLNTQPEEQATLNTQPVEQATFQPREQTTLDAQRSEDTPDSLQFEAASDVQF